MIFIVVFGMGVVMFVMSYFGVIEICISKFLSESIMMFLDIDIYRKCSNLVIK